MTLNEHIGKFTAQDDNFCSKCGEVVCECCMECSAKDREIEALVEALQALYNEQNGPPLIRDEKSWQAAMDKAEKLLNPEGYTGFYKKDSE